MRFILAKVVRSPLRSCTTPWIRPRATTLPSRLAKPSGTNEPVTLRPLPVVPAILEVSWPKSLCATGRSPAAACA